jgi:hypothetical protein
MTWAWLKNRQDLQRTSIIGSAFLREQQRLATRPFLRQ